MSLGDVLLTAGIFLGGAAPWLEAVVVIPAGIVAGLHPVVAVLAGATGNLLTVGIAAWSGERIRRWWRARRRARRGADTDTDPTGDPPRDRRAARAKRIVQRWGMPMLALLGPLGLGTQVSAVVAVGIGITSRAAFAWIGAATVVWSLIAAAAALTGVSVAGIG
ncbi:putative membrane protein [Lipingzhangella halophila]|uniref:Putative membrane protein n=1 Tax=Lipingzhangella halophila TaxID=1783352 RepID=A0A7W7RFK5_9ACTN|nr:small multi-drug export protein [Lipingzhangella halophila]MBB4930728.1 putative membrane protein [Lipingzhangella halophila]